MEKQELEARFDEKLGLFNQNRALAQNALAGVNEGLKQLRALGFDLSLVEAPAAARQEWPKMFYHSELAPLGRVVETPQDAAGEGVSKAAGWRETPMPVDEPEPMSEPEPEPEPKKPAPVKVTVGPPPGA